MSIFKRFQNLIKSNLNDFLDKAEDPAKMANQAVLDFEDNIRKAKTLLLSLMATNNLLRKKLLMDEHSKYIQDEIEKNDEKIHLIKQGLKQLAQKNKELKEKALAIKQASSKVDAKKTIEIQPIKDYLADTSSFDTFDRMQEKIEYSEANIEALVELINEEEKEKAAPLSDAAHSLELDPQKLKDELELIRKKVNFD